MAILNCLLVIISSFSVLAVISSGGSEEPLICCRTVKLESTGSLAESEQKHIIGTYVKNSHDGDGSANYRQIENLQKYLYYMPEYSVRPMFILSKNMPMSTMHFAEVVRR
jgi:hypothetical protein